MPGYQYCVIMGNVGRDAEMRYTQSGVAVCDFSVAVTRKWSARDGGEQREETTWFRVSAWRGLAETCGEYVRKGMPIMVAGRVGASSYIAQDGEARASLELTAVDVQFLGHPQDGTAERRNVTPQEQEDLPF
ncbi:MAG: single-stranded DNA-binding protein [Planctomycetota bacterium]|jgi:single-strand DNA-binding protein